MVTPEFPNISSQLEVRWASVLRILRNTDRPMASYIWRAWIVAFIPSIVISAIVTLALALPSNKVPSPTEPHLFWVVAALLLSPWGETLVMWPMLSILKRLGETAPRVALVSALAWGFIHSRFAIGWGFIVIWPFFVFSLCFLEWEKKSKLKALIVTGLVHTCQNMVPVVLELLAGLAGVKT